MMASGIVQREGDVLNLYPGKLKNLSAWLGDLTIDSRDFQRIG
jgi:hypothetical protein